MKKILAFFLCAILLLSMIACDSSAAPVVPSTDEEAQTPEDDTSSPSQKEETPGFTSEEGWLNVATYNIIRCQDQSTTNKTTNPDNIVNLIDEYDLDIVGLNEVDVNNARSAGKPGSDYYNGGSHQPRYIAEQLTEKTGEQYYWTFAEGLDGFHSPAHTAHGNARYGNAIISKYPIVSTRSIQVAVHEIDPDNPKTQTAAGDYERRVILFAEIDVDGQIVTVISSHFGLCEDEREKALRTLENELDVIETPVIFMGDLNCSPSSEIILKLNLLLNPTSTANKPATHVGGKRIDYIFTDGSIRTKDLTVLKHVGYSDHYPVIVKVKLPENKTVE